MLRNLNSGAACKRWYKTWGMQCDKLSLQQLFEHEEKYTNLQERMTKDVSTIFACNKTILSNIKYYGFSYNEVFVHYNTNFNSMIYNTIKYILVDRYRYPKDVLDLKYDPTFPIMGLHFDSRYGNIIKLDSFIRVQANCIYRGKTEVSNEDIKKQYKRMVIPYSLIDPSYTDPLKSVKNLTNYYSNPEIDLTSSIIDVFDKNDIKFIPTVLYKDIKKCVFLGKPLYSKMIREKTAQYLNKASKVRMFLERLRNADKKMFIIANSSFQTINNGMSYIVGEDWQDFFDIVILQANKPSFFRDEKIPFREFDVKTKSFVWGKPEKFKKHRVYLGGNVYKFMKMTGWKPSEVLFIGSNPYKDLADITTSLGWKTCAIVNELSYDLKICNTDEFRKNDFRIRLLSKFIEQRQERIQTVEDQEFLNRLKEERYICIMKDKMMFNKYFGSVFRSNDDTSMYGRRLFRSCNIYTVEIGNFLNYNLTQIFLPSRVHMPHEYVITKTFERYPCSTTVFQNGATDECQTKISSL